MTMTKRKRKDSPDRPPERLTPSELVIVLRIAARQRNDRPDEGSIRQLADAIHHAEEVVARYVEAFDVDRYEAQQDPVAEFDNAPFVATLQAIETGMTALGIKDANLPPSVRLGSGYEEIILRAGGDVRHYTGLVKGLSMDGGGARSVGPDPVSELGRWEKELEEATNRTAKRNIPTPRKQLSPAPIRRRPPP